MKAIATIALTLVALPASAKEHHSSRRAMHTTRVHQRDASVAQPARVTRPCFHDPITIMRGTEEDRFTLTRCDGTATHEGVDRLSVLARPDAIPRPKHGPLPAGVRRIDARLAERLQQVADHFAGHASHAVTIHVVSGYRPNSVGSYHSTAQAIDFRIDGVQNERLVDFCKTLPDTGCGYYPNSSFVHLDVRAAGTGHVSWIDASGPGETAHYVASWPAPPAPNYSTEEKKGEETYVEKLARILPPLPIDEHPGRVMDGMINAKLDDVRLVH